MSIEPTTRTLPAGYMEQAATTAIYSPQWAVIYPALGLGNEVAELADKIMAGKIIAAHVLAELGDVLWYVSALARDARVLPEELTWTAGEVDGADALRHLIAAAGDAQGHVKKSLRDHEGNLDARRDGLVDSLSQVLAAADAIVQRLASTIEEVCAANLAKLAGRAARMTLGGDGDVR